MAYSTVVALIAIWLAIKTCEAAATGAAVAAATGPSSNTTSAGQPCPQAHWYDILWFYFSNFIIHALSVRSLPGEDGFTAFIFKFSCFLVPFTGARRGLSAILRADILITDGLEAAVESGAACMVVRTHNWQPRNGEKIKGCATEVNDSEPHKLKKCSVSSDTTASTDEASYRTDSNASDSPGTYLDVKSLYKARKLTGFGEKVFTFLLVSWRYRERPIENLIIQNPRAEVQGSYWLPDGYALAMVPTDVKIWPQTIGRCRDNVRAAKTRLASSYNMPRVLFAITQTILGVWTVYNARGTQLNRYGYAAYGFTVIPYAAMSIINLIGGMVSREYDDIFLVHSEVMDEMIARGGVAEGYIGTTCPPADRVGFALKKNEFQLEEEKKFGDLCLQFEGASTDEEPATECRDVGEGYTAGQEYVISHLEPRPKAKPLVWWEPPWTDYPFRKAKKTVSRFPKGATVLSVPSHPPLVRRKPRPESRFLQLFTGILLCALVITPYIMIYALSKFQPQQSTGGQRSFTMTWLVWGLLNGFLASETEQLSIREFKYALIVMIFVFYGSNTVGGFVTIAQEMLQLGSCDQLGF